MPSPLYQPGEDPLTRRIIGAAMQVHRGLGPGLLESVYEDCLAWELGDRALTVQRQVSVPVRYRRVTLETGYRLDLLVEWSVIVEVKSVVALAPIVDAQVLTYLKLLDLHTALAINFNVEKLRDGIRRVVR